MKKLFLTVLCLVVFAIFLPFKGYSLGGALEEIKLYVGTSEVISVSSPKRVVIGNPVVADVANIGKSELTITPKAAGSTNLVVWDNFGEQSYKIKVFAEDMQKIKARVDNLIQRLSFPDVYTKAEDEEAKVLLLGRVKTNQDRERIASVLGALKDKTVDLIEVKEEEAVIVIDVQVLELDKDASETLGFTWPGSINFTEIGSPGIGAAGTTWGKVFKVANVNRSDAGTAAPFTLKLDALVQEGKVRILSKPHLACQSGKEAELLVGGEKPVFTTSTTEGGSTSSDVEYKEFGIKLKIKPFVAGEEKIKVSLNVEVSEVGAVETLGSETTTTARAYPLSKRTISTELFMNNGQTLAIGGLIKQKSTDDLYKIPFLGDVPVLGWFFKKKTTTSGGGTGERGDVELFIILTPRLMVPPAAEEKKIINPEENALSVQDEDTADPVLKYARIIQRRILDNLTYPAQAKEAGFQGTAKIALKLSYQGNLIAASIKDGSGYVILDDNALKIAKEQAPYPPFPPEVQEKELLVDVPITYKLE